MKALPEFYEALFGAIHKGDTDRIRALVGSGVSFEPSFGGISLLHCAADMQTSAVVEALLGSPVFRRELNAFDEISYTPLMYAVRRSDIEMINTLVNAGADINAHEEWKAGNTAIRVAAETANAATVQTLLKAGADPTIPGWMHLTAVHQAERRYERDPSQENETIFKLIRDAASGKVR